MGKDWLSVQDSIRTYLGTDISLLNKVNANTLDHCGKQMRPALCLLMARACGSGVCTGDTIKYATSAELLHNATLFHDDVADESDERRGHPTVRALMGPSASVLLGDFWLVRALRAVLDAGGDHDRTVGMFSRTLSDLAEGEMLQLQKASTADTVFEDYLNIIYRKTSSIFVTTCLAAAISVGASKEYEDAAMEYARFLGYAFQMRDDIFDYMPSSGVGKPVGIDIMEQKITLPLLCALETIPVEEQELVRSKVRNINTEYRDEIISLVRERGGLEAAQKVAEDYCSKAKAALAPLPDSSDKEYLFKLVEYAVSRTK